jgi:tetratricopeptide (TPR) repeat protein
VLVAGSVDRAPVGYTISLRLVDPVLSRTLTTATAAAPTTRDVLQAVESLGNSIRSALGDVSAVEKRAVEARTTIPLEAMRNYALAVNLHLEGQDEGSIAYFKRAIDQEPEFGAAYYGWFVSTYNLRRTDEARKVKEQLLGVLDHMSDRARYRTLSMVYLTEGDWPKAIDSHRALLKQYPNDATEWNELAIVLMISGDLQAAFGAQRRAVELAPRQVVRRYNYALYAMYLSDFDTAASEANLIIRQQPDMLYAYVPLAVALLARSDSAGAQEAYARMSKSSSDEEAGWTASIGLADLALYEGRIPDAERILTERLATGIESGNAFRQALLYAVLAETYELKGEVRSAIDAIQKALRLSRKEMSMPAARLLVRLGDESTALTLASELDKQGAKQRAYAKIIEGEVIGKARDLNTALQSFRAALAVRDLWLTHFDLGVTYVELGDYPSALSELETCHKRRGEATAILFDDYPTFRYLTSLSYWLGRAQEGSGLKAAAIASYKTFHSHRARVVKDSLADDARRRIVALGG